MVIHKYMMATSAIQQARKVGRKDLKYPWRFKKNYNTMTDKQNIQVDYKKGIIRIPRPRSYDYIDERGKKKQNPIYLHCKPSSIPPNITQVEFIYNNELKLAINYFVEEECLQIESNSISAIDLGEIHSITSTDTQQNNLITTGRKIRSIQRFRNKELGTLQKKLSKCTKSSRNYKRYRKAIRKLLSKSNEKLNNDLKKTAKIYSDYVIMNNISTVVIGDLKQFNRHLGKRKNRKGTKQKLVQWQHGQLIQKLHYNLDKHNVKIVEISEAYTSQTCPCCGHRYKPKGRNYICIECGFTGHRDLVGAINILSKYINKSIVLHKDNINKHIKYLRI
jgi:putative transposase